MKTVERKKGLEKDKSLRANSKTGVGLFLILLGLFFFAREYGIIPKDLPWWPMVLILAGLFLLFQGFANN